jgi:hypothetical protein
MKWSRDERGSRQETTAVLSDEELMEEIRQGIHLPEKNEAELCAIEEPSRRSGHP